MAVFNLGSINADIFYDVPHIVNAGETLAASDRHVGLGGKGANQSVALLRAGAQVCHIGAVGNDGGWMKKRLAEYGLGIDHIQTVDMSSGHAVIMRASDGENSIILFAGANQNIAPEHITISLNEINAGDWLVMQNETNGQKYAAEIARQKGAKIAYSAAPFDEDAVKDILPYIDVLAVNEGEAAALCKALNAASPAELPIPAVVVTLGAKGAIYYDNTAKRQIKSAGQNVKPVDTTGAGDTFFGFFLAALASGLPAETALARANHAAALKVTRRGTSDVIPMLKEVLEKTD